MTHGVMLGLKSTVACLTRIPLEFILGESRSPAMRKVDRIIRDIAPTGIPVVLWGESGTGKEVVAMRIHELSRFGRQPFFKLIASALTPEDFEGGIANNDALPSRDLSAVGSIYLDEVSELTAACQQRLVNLLPDGEPSHGGCLLGSRVISATTRNLGEEVRLGRFREDLFYRMTGICIRIPSLNQRQEDIPALIEIFLAKYAEQFQRPKPTLSPAALNTLMDHRWPGNIRQLENSIKRLVALGDEGLALSDLRSAPEGLPGTLGRTGATSLKVAARVASQKAERELILRVLGETRWNRKKAARELQISYKALLYKLKQIRADGGGGIVSPEGARE